MDINETITTLDDLDSDGIFDFQSENGTITSFDGTDDQNASEVTVTPSGTITSTDVQSALQELDANSSDNQDLILTGDNLSLTKDPTATPIDLSAYRETVAGANDIIVTDDGNGNYTVDYTDGDKSATNELQTLSQIGTAVTLSNSGGTISVADNDNDSTNEITTVTDNLDGTSTIVDVNGGTVTLDNDGIDNVDDADNVIGNEYNTGSAITGGNLEITDGGGTESVNLISSDTNNNIAFGSDGALYLNVASVTISETITTLSDNGNGSFTYTNESGAPVTFQASTIIDNGNGTSTIALADGGTITVDNDGIDNVDDADSDPTNEDQTVSAGTGIGVNQVGDDFEVTNMAPDQTVTIADGGNGNVTVGGSYPNFTIDVPDATVDTDDQTLSISADQLSISEGNTVTLPGADGTETIVERATPT